MDIRRLEEGDIVEYWHPRKQRWVPIEITVEFLCELKKDGTLDPPDLRLINLTPGILELNGFTCEDNFGILEWVSEDKRIILRNDQNYINSGKGWYIHVDSPDMSTICTAELNHLHELQHILRHCEINMELRAE